jgi:hypothetical protein
MDAMRQFFGLLIFVLSAAAFSADVHWTGTATAAAQVDTITATDVEIADIFTLTITGWDGTSTAVSFTATAATAANAVEGIKAAWNASTHALCTPVTADANSLDGTVTLTADTAGVAFSVAATETDGGGTDDQTFTRAATVASAGPKHWDAAGNWDTGSVPGGAAGQDVYIESASGEILYGLDQSGIANALAGLHIEKTFTGKIGVNGATGRAGTYLEIPAAVVNIGYNYSGASATGSGRLMIDTGSTASTITVYATATASADSGKPACRLLAASSSTDIRVMTGKAGIAYEPGETATIDDLTIGYTSAAAADTAVTVGSGLTVDDISKRVGTLTLRSACDALINESGACYLYGSGTVGTLTINSGTVYSSTTGTITTVNATAGTLDLTGLLTARTITTLNLGNGGAIRYDPSIITVTNGITSVEADGKFLITKQAF